MNEPEDQATYIEALKKYDKSLLKLFPDRLPNNMFGYGITQPYDNVQGGLNLTLKYFSQGEYILSNQNLTPIRLTIAFSLLTTMKV
jgi:hypothetical protein